MLAKLAVSLVVVFLLAACMPVQPVMEVSAQPADLEAQVNAIWDEYEASLNAGDIDRWVEVWTEDGVQMPPDAAYVEGKEAIRARNAAAFAPFDVDMGITNLEAGTGPEWAFARGVYTATLTPKEGGPAIPIDGKYMTILQQQPDGSWKVHRDIFNSNVPPAAPVEEDMEAVIDAIWTEYAAANVAGDVDRWIALWDENGVQMPPGSMPIEGKEAILANKQAGAAKWVTDEMTITNLEYEVAGDWAFVRGVYQATRTPVAGGDSVQIDGKYMSILHKQPDGSWKLYRDIFNSNVP